MAAKEESWRSRCVVERATHDFEVTNFSLLDGMGTDKYVSSCPFRVGDCEWKILVFPDGCEKGEDALHVSVFLQLQDVNPREGAPGVSVKFGFSLLDGRGQACYEVAEGDTFTYKQYFGLRRVEVDWGLEKFIEKSKLRDILRRDGDDTLRIRCVLTVIKEPQHELVEKKIFDDSMLYWLPTSGCH